MIHVGNDGLRFVEMVVEVPGTAEEVWAAVSTGPGISCWFTPTRVEEQEGGAIVFELGPGMESAGEITRWSPPVLLGYVEREWMEGAPPLMTEVRIEAKEVGLCAMRMVHSLITDVDAWDEQLESMENGWPPFFVILREYMTHYRNLSCTSVRLLAKTSESEAETWERLQAAFGLEGLAVDRSFVSTSSAGVPIGGSVMALGTAQCPHQAMLRLDSPGHGFVTMGAYTWGGEGMASASFYFYGGEARAMAAAQERWASWFAEVFA